MDWIDNEKGPKCGCGMPTLVKIMDGKPLLFCVFHEQEEGACWSLPKERPDNWADISREEVEKLIMEARDG